MKYLFTILLLTTSIISYGNDVSLYSQSQNSFLIGGKATIITKHSKEYFEYLKKNEVKLSIAGIRIPYELSIYQDSLLKWELNIPALNKLVGKDKELYFDDGTNKKNSVKINLFSEKPDVQSFSINNGENVVYTDMLEPQNIKLTLNNAAYINKLVFIDKNIRIKGTNTNTISSSSIYFKTDKNNTLSLNFVPKDFKSLDFLLYYTNNKFNSVSTDTIKLDISKDKRFNEQRFNTSTDANLYIDDFDRTNSMPKIYFEFGNNTIIGKNFKILNENPNIKISTLTGDEFDMPKDKKVQVLISNIKTHGSYEVKVTSNSGESFSSLLNVLPKPEIKEFTISNSVNNEIKRDFTKIYSVIVKGSQLHQMNEVQLELVSTTSSNAYPLKKLSNIDADKIDAQLDFTLNQNQKLPVGKYYLQLIRSPNFIEGRKIYPLHAKQITVTYPNRIFTDQVNLVSLKDPQLFYKESIPKKYNALKQHLLAEGSNISLIISPNMKSYNEYGPQYLKVTATHIKSDGNEVLLNIKEKEKDFITVLDSAKHIDLKKEFGIESLNVNEKIKIVLSHSPDKYGSTMLSSANEITYHRGVSFLDKMGVTLSIPPYLASFRNVRRKAITKDEDGNSNVEYSGEKEIEFQSLTINAGLGIKFRDKDKLYKPSRFALGMYLMSLDLADNSSKKEQKADTDNHNFIARGSINLMLLGEVLFLNLDKSNAYIPGYLGIVYIFDPIDRGSKFAPVLGVGIDIKLFGSHL
ncbi:hypothetical protein ACFS7Z_08525 [Pontibacter toksunensis]|uniref:Uncharacterized protein n=1 Tax=Pontibacter toksunensis TaxID=1332631 RepID=A0ABW6BSW7_9BACT